MGRYVLGVSGASGIILAYRTICALAEFNHQIELIMSSYALYTASIEMGKEFSTAKRFLNELPEPVQEKVHLHSINDMGSPTSSGSYPVDGMVIIPCSMTTVAAVSLGLGDNAMRRAADVNLKEKRPLVIVPREAPLGLLHLENLLKLSRLGATIVPPVPAWYPQPQSLEDVENFIVGKTLEALGLNHNLYKRWKFTDSPNHQEAAAKNSNFDVR